MLKSLEMKLKDEIKAPLEAKIAPVFEKYQQMIKPKIDKLLEPVEDFVQQDLPPTISVLNKLIKFTHTLQVSHPVIISTVDSKLIALLNWLERCYSAISKIGGEDFQKNDPSVVQALELILKNKNTLLMKLNLQGGHSCKTVIHYSSLALLLH